MFDLKISILEEYAPFFVSGTLLTIKLSVVAIVAGFFLGLFLALARIFPSEVAVPSGGLLHREHPGGRRFCCRSSSLISAWCLSS
jgi:ABC-type amino acid transport system permease subunit